MRKILFIINPVAGSGKSKEYIKIIKEKMEFENIDFDIKISNSIGNVEEISLNADDEIYTDIVSVGGDGTLFETINGMANKKVNLGIIAGGTGNDFIRSVEIPTDIYEALEIIKNGKIKDIDLGMVNGKYFINVVSFGIDGEIVRITDKIKKYIKGSAAYLSATLKSLVVYKAKSMLIEIDGVKYHREAYLVAVGNGKYFGGGMKVLPNAEIDDELLDICIVKKMSKVKLIALFPSIFSGKHISIKGVEYFKGKKVSIKSIKDKIIVNADGNLIGPSPAKIEILNKKIKLLV